MRIRGILELVSSHRILLGVLLAYLATVVFVVPPTGEYPTYDDGVFAATARDFATTGVMHVSDLPSMTLVTHAAWGAAFIRVLGDSWWTLRVSSMVMVWIGGVALYSLGLQCGRSRSESALFCASYVWCPLVFGMSYTYNTDLTGTSLMLITLAAIPGCLRAGTPLALTGLGCIGALAWLARQTAAIPALVLCVVLAVECLSRRRRWRDLICVVIPLMMAVAGYTWWLHQVNGVPSVYGAVTLKADLLTQPKGLISKIIGIALEMALMSAPIIVLTTCYPAPGRIRGWTRTAWGAGLAVVLFCLVFAAELSPYRGYEFFDAGLGFPPTHEGLYTAFRSPEAGMGVTWFHLLVLIPSAILLGALSATLVESGFDVLRNRKFNPIGTLQVVVLISIFGYCALLVLIEFVFDRYLIPLIVLGLVAWATCGGPSDSSRPQWPAWLTLVVSSVICVAATMDAIQIRGAYWSTVYELHDDGVAIDDLNAGSTYWQTFVYEPAVRAREHSGPTFLSGLSREPWNGYGPEAAHWRLTFGPSPGWDVYERVPFTTCLRAGELVIHNRSDPSR